MTWPPIGLDPEVRSFCEAINGLPGLQTRESCCGHGERSFSIWLEAKSVEALMPLSYWLDNCHSGCRGWRLVVITDCSHDPDSVHFKVEGPMGKEGYYQANKIADLIVENEGRP